MVEDEVEEVAPRDLSRQWTDKNIYGFWVKHSWMLMNISLLLLCFILSSMEQLYSLYIFLDFKTFSRSFIIVCNAHSCFIAFSDLSQCINRFWFIRILNEPCHFSVKSSFPLCICFKGFYEKSGRYRKHHDGSPE